MYNVDRTLNKGGPIRFVVPLRLKIGDHVDTNIFAVTGTGPNKIILGLSWLRCGKRTSVEGLEEDDEENEVEDATDEETWDDMDDDTSEGERLFILPEDIETIRAS